MTLNHVHFQVRDLPAAVDWFTAVLELKPRFQNDRIATFIFGAMTVLIDAGAADSFATLGFESHDCDRDFQAVIARGAAPIEEPVNKGWGVRTAYFKGPGTIKCEIEGRSSIYSEGWHERAAIHAAEMSCLSKGAFMETHKEHFLKTQQLHENAFHRILWDDKSRVIGIDWLEGTSSMTDGDFKKELAIFADHVEAKKAVGILVDVAQFRHKPGPDIEEWRVKNISGHYYAGGLRRFAFLFPEGVSAPPMKSSQGEKFETRAFNRAQDALAWLQEADRKAAV